MDHRTVIFLVAGICLLVGGVGPKATAGLLVGSSTLGILGLVSTHWWVKLCPEGLWLEGPGGLWSSTCALICGARS